MSAFSMADSDTNDVKNSNLMLINDVYTIRVMRLRHPPERTYSPRQAPLLSSIHKVYLLKNQPLMGFKH